MRVSFLSVLLAVGFVFLIGCGGKEAAFQSDAAKEAPTNGRAASADRRSNDSAAPNDSYAPREKFRSVDSNVNSDAKPTSATPAIMPAPKFGSPDAEPTKPNEGIGPGESGDKFEHIVENDFLRTADNTFSTFSIDVDTASYAKTRMYLMQHGMLPPRDAVRIEELINYFSYDYAGPSDDHPFAAHVETAECPWEPKHRLVRIGVKGYETESNEREASNLVFLIDRSGSMQPVNKLPLVKEGMQMLAEQLDERDVVTIVAYAGSAQVILPPTPGNRWDEISRAIDQLQAGGSTAGSAGLEVAYRAALDNFVTGGTNRVILCTDGDFNVGTTSPGELVQQVEEYAKKNVYMTVLGFGMGNHNDLTLEQISNKGNGNYAFVDTRLEARKVLVEQMSGTLVTIAKDVKIQVEFNPHKVAAYRLIGYENRKLAAEDFNDDKKDAGEIGAGHCVTALYEIVPVGVESAIAASKVDAPRYQQPANLSESAKSDELLNIKLRYKQPDGDTSTLIQFTSTDSGHRFGQATEDFRFAAAVASFGMLLRGSKYKGNLTYDAIAEIATAAKGKDDSGYRKEFLSMVQRARDLAR